jgi:UDP-N-acetylmuramyl pentapeptide phosphotransferase/UDP-N-acetylglucosamine-1-phosphate transferase
MPASGDSFVWLLVDGAVVALAANLANLFDRAPGRVTKVASVSVVALVLACMFGAPGPVDAVLPGLFGVVVVMGAAWGLLMPELREEMMLGDTGANPMGAAIGLAVVLTQSQAVRLGVLLLLLALNLVSERVSFSSVIQRVGVLRVVDQLGRRPPDT